MKKIVNLKSSLLTSLTLAGALFLPMGEARADENDELSDPDLCGAFCKFCSKATGPYCMTARCDTGDPCFPLSQALIECLSGQGMCTASETEQETICLQQEQDFQTCKTLLPTCGDGIVTGQEECEDPDGNSQVCVDCQLIGS